MPDRYFFEIPIYQTPRERFDHAYGEALEAHLAEVRRQFTELGAEPSSSTLGVREQLFWRGYGGPWHYNQSVGWLRLFLSGNQARADLWFTNAKRLTRQLNPRPISLQGKAFELWIQPEHTSHDIAARLREELLAFQSSFRNGRHHLDISCFDTISPFVDWRRLAAT